MSKDSDASLYNDFILRHIGPRDVDIAAMLGVVGASSLDDLTAKVVPEDILEDSPPETGKGLSEHQALMTLEKMIGKNKVYRSLIGQGYHDTITPPVILRNVLQNPGWYTAYTPYQPEISQGRLEALINFQQMVMDLTAMEMANASLLDEATAAAEAMTLARRMSKAKSNIFLVAENCHPQTIAVAQTRAAPLGIEVVLAQPQDLVQQEGFGLLLQYPTTTGGVEDYVGIVKAAHDKDMLVAVAADLLALTLLTPPGEWGADIVVGSTQRFGVPLGFGGPHAAYFATREAYKRSVPGRIVGVSVDKGGNTAYRLALQTREQHIRREKATSNICTAQVLLANIAGFYAVYHGPAGLTKMARQIHNLATLLAAGLEKSGFELQDQHFFDTVTVKTDDAAAILARAVNAKLNLRDFGDGRLSIALDEKSTSEEVAELLRVFAGKEVSLKEEFFEEVIPENLQRQSAFLTHPTFHRYRSETQMMRYLRKLEQKDIALNRSMIPLGSCTMKLNAAAEMMPVSWPKFCDIHPFAPVDQTKGYQKFLDDFEQKLCVMTGFAAVSMQPNSGAQGEYAGLLAIREYHLSHGDDHRNICLIPASAHGTNPASAVMCGMKVVIVKCDIDGNVDLEDLTKKAETHKNNLAAFMVTYPSTHGVFEPGIRRMCKIIHDAGGQVYMDGANLNAMVGLARPGAFGIDVMHMNLHKTFCIPHGGGGPGMGPIGVAEHLKSFLPGKINTVSAAAYGSASILPISWMYIAMMGAQGLKKATQVAILNANYMAKKLGKHYNTLYKGENGYVAHECILDTRMFKDSAGVSVDDIAKRLMDFGFHAPTISFPVPGTVMIEPTESEDKEEMDRFITAMISIRNDIQKIENGTYQSGDNPLHNAPHTLEDVTARDWTRSYSRAEAMVSIEDKYWPPVGRIDQAAGDRNFICACPPLESYEEAA